MAEGGLSSMIFSNFYRVSKNAIPIFQSHMQNHYKKKKIWKYIKGSAKIVHGNLDINNRAVILALMWIWLKCTVFWEILRIEIFGSPCTKYLLEYLNKRTHDRRSGILLFHMLPAHGLIFSSYRFILLCFGVKG